MAKEKCPKCKKVHDGKCKTKKGGYGLSPEELEQDESEVGSLDSVENPLGDDAMNERREFNVDIDMKGMSGEKKRKALDDFRTAAAEAKKRNQRKDEDSKLRAQTREKGVRFYDKRGSGYIRKGKKHYD